MNKLIAQDTKRAIIEIETDINTGNHTFKVSNEVLPMIQKWLVNGSPNDTVIQFEFSDI